MVPSCGPQKCPLELILVDVYPPLLFSQPTVWTLAITVEGSPLCAVPSHCSHCTVSSGLESAYFFQREISKI